MARDTNHYHIAPQYNVHAVTMQSKQLVGYWWSIHTKTYKDKEPVIKGTFYKEHQK